jgi:multiple sugar transport system ATP-binding protein
MAEFLGLEGKLGVKAGKLGGSEMQRVAIGRTLVTRPSILLLDEPLSNLEAEVRLSTRQELRRLSSELGLTIIYVTHDQVEALSLADKLAIMSHGRIVESGPTAEIVERPANVQVARFLGVPPMNVLGGYFHESGGGIMFRHETADLRLPLESLPPGVKTGDASFHHLGVRPEDLRLSTGPEPLFEGVVAGLEHRGFDQVVTVAGRGAELKALSRGTAPDWGERVSLDAQARDLFLFDRRGQLMSAGLAGQEAGRPR